MKARPEELVHAAPWNPKELHLGPGSCCYACGTWSVEAAAKEEGAVADALAELEELEERERLGSSVFLTIAAAVLFAVVLLAVIVDVWP